MSWPDPSCKAVDFVENLLEKLGVQGCEVKSEKTDDGLCITVEGGDRVYRPQGRNHGRNTVPCVAGGPTAAKKATPACFSI